MLQYRNSSLPIASDFWSKCKRHLKSSSSSIFAFISPNGDTVKDANGMCEIGANFYENLFKKSIIYLPHPYTDSPVPEGWVLRQATMTGFDCCLHSHLQMAYSILNSTNIII